MTDDVWEPLVRELDRWREAGRKARFWLRDDDAVEPTEALEKLIAATKAKSVPLALAVIPAQTGDVLAKRLSGETLVSVAVHGWSVISDIVHDICLVHTLVSDLLALQEVVRGWVGDWRSRLEVFSELRDVWAA